MTLFESHSSSSLFALPSLEAKNGDQATRYAFPELKSVESHFALPRLDEYAAGQDRMLVGLKEGIWWSLKDSPVDVQGKGKERATGAFGAEVMVQIAPSNDVELQGGTEKTISEWDQMAERMGIEAEAGPSRPRTFKPIPTWDDHQGSCVGNPFVSEAGRAVFEAINVISDPPLALPNLRAQAPSAPVDPEDLLRLMIHATMGTTITEALRWDPRKGVYAWGGEGHRMIGLSRIATTAAVQDFLDIATALRRLDQLLDQQSKALLTPTHHALFHAVSTYLTFIKNRLSSAISDSEAEEVLSWIKWKATLRDVRELLNMLLEIMEWPLLDAKSSSLPAKPASLLTHLYSHLLAHHQTSSPSSSATPTILCLAYLLQTSSTPFLRLLHAWVGLSDTAAETGSLGSVDQPWADLGITRTPRTVQHGEEMTWDYDFSARRMPAFIPKDCRRKLFEAGRSLRLLREADQGHPLSGGGWGLEGSWGWGEAFADVHMDVRRHTRRIGGEIEHWRQSVKERSRPLSGGSSYMRTRHVRKERKRIPTAFYDPSLSTPSHPVAEGRKSPDDEVETADATINAEKQLADFLDMLNMTPGAKYQSAEPASLRSSTPLDTLHSFIAFHSAHPILPASYPTFPLFISHHLLAPLLAHADLVSAALVSLYIDDLHFTDHLDILQAFWLGGDVGFFERVSSALFGREDQDVMQGSNMGRRARTRARMGMSSEGAVSGKEDGEWGIALGIGLSDRRRWPPGGAELAYALQTTLLDDVGGHTGGIRDGVAWAEVEDRVSFAIRPLPEDEDGVRAKWMDPQAIEALDFLYLSYTPPPAMSVVLPRAILAKYQTINNFLLRLCRVEAVIRSTFHDLHKPLTVDTLEEPKQGVDVPRTRSRGPSTSRPPRRALFSFDLALAKTVHHLRFRMSHFISALMRYIVDSAIGSNFDRMRNRLDRLKCRRGSKMDRPCTPDGDGYSDFGYGDASAGYHDSAEEKEWEGDEAGDIEEDDDVPIHHLRSIHSLVTYHHITLDRIMRSCLLAPSAGYDVAFKLLMRLCGLILDMGKLVKETSRRSISESEAGESILEMQREWEEKETVFMLALERLSQKHDKVDGAPADAADMDRDIEVLREGEYVEGHAAQASGLGELLLRLKLGHGEDKLKAGRWSNGI